MKRIIDMLTECGAEQWKIIVADTESYQMFFVHGSVETVRRTESRETVVTVYSNHDGKTGNSSFKVYTSTTDGELKKKIEAAKDKALLIFDEAYTLPSNEKGEYELSSNLTGVSPVQLGSDVASVVLSAKMPDNCAVNALEIFVNKTRKRVINSCGIDKTQTADSIGIEVIPTCNGKDQSVELYKYYNIAEFDKKSLSEEISARMSDVYARSVAVKPGGELNCPVILGSGELKEFFGTLIEDAEYSSIYSHANLHSVGDMLQTSPIGDKITVDMKNIVKGNVGGSYFDADGTQLVNKRVIEDGKLVGSFGTRRFAEYLGEKPTGALRCMEVQPGTSSEEELRSRPYLECVGLSGLQVDPYNDYIGGEVRLAYYYDGEKRVPITGISISGKISEVIETLRLSDKMTVDGGYYGPSLGLFENMKIF